MKSKRIILTGCLGVVALFASPARAQYRQNVSGQAMISSPHATTHVMSHSPYSGSIYGGRGYYGTNWRHHRFHGGSPFYFCGGYPFGYYGYYPYYWDWPWGSDYYSPYSYGYYNSQRAYGYTSDAVVARVQRQLADEGYYSGAIDGVLGPRTRAAIRAYENTNRMAVDGVISNRLLSRMRMR